MKMRQPDKSALQRHSTLVEKNFKQKSSLHFNTLFPILTHCAAIEVLGRKMSSSRRMSHPYGTLPSSVLPDLHIIAAEDRNFYLGKADPYFVLVFPSGDNYHLDSSMTMSFCHFGIPEDIPKLFA